MLLKKIATWFFIIGIFIIPFNSFSNPLPFMGEFSKESAIIFFLLGAVFFYLTGFITGKIAIPFKSKTFLLLLCFLSWCVITTLININYLFDTPFKKIFGYERFIRQYGALLISFFIFIYFYNVVRTWGNSKALKYLRKIFTCSFIIVSIYCFLEFLIIRFNATFLNPVIELFNYFPFVDVYVDVNHGRLSSVAYEPPFLAIYLITVAGWMFSYVLDKEKSLIKYLPTILVLFWAFASGSRTAFAVIFVQFFVFCFFYFKMNNINAKVLFKPGLSVIVILIITILVSSSIRDSITEKLDTLNFKKNLTENVSNQSRIGIQSAAIDVFKRNKITGVGFGQAAYHMRPFYPEWALRGNYEFRLLYLNQNIKAFPPNYNIYTRLLAETGLIGFIIFISFLVLIIRALIIRFYNSDIGTSTNIMAVILIVSFVGYSINWFQIDTFRIFGFWICLALLMPKSSLELYD